MEDEYSMWDVFMLRMEKIFGMALPVLLVIWGISEDNGMAICLASMWVLLWRKLEILEDDLAILMVAHKDEIERIVEEHERDSER